MVPKSQLRTLVRDGTFSAIAEEGVFSPVSSYVPRFVHPTKTGVRALDARVKTDDAPNFNNLAYLVVSNKFLQEDLRYIRTEPGAYAMNVALSAELWFAPADQYPPSGLYGHSYAHIATYAKIYDAGILWQVHGTSDAGYLATAGRAPSASVLSYSTMAEYAFGLLLAPFVILRRRRDRFVAGMLSVLWLTVAYSFVTTSLISLGENMRFQFELGSLPLVLAAGALAALLRAVPEPLRSAQQSGGSLGRVLPVEDRLGHRATA